MLLDRIKHDFKNKNMSIFSEQTRYVGKIIYLFNQSIDSTFSPYLVYFSTELKFVLIFFWQ